MEGAGPNVPTARKRTATPPPQTLASTTSEAKGTTELTQRRARHGSNNTGSGSFVKDTATQRWLHLHQRGIIALALALAAVLLVIVPGGYCWLNQGRAELADTYRGGAHPGDSSCHTCRKQGSPGGHHRPALYLGRDYVNEVAAGGLNGILMMVGTVVAGIGLDMPGQNICAMGTASLAAYGFSMGFGAFVVEQAKEEFAISQLQQEYEEVRSMPEAEVDEMICHYRNRGLVEEDARAIAKILSRYEDFWVHHMMAEELGIQLPRGGTAAVASGLATGASFLVFGLVPLLGPLVSTTLRHLGGPEWYRPQFSTAVSLTLSAVVLLTLGAFVSRVVGSRTPLINGMMMLANGCFASIVAYGLSQCLSPSKGSICEGSPEQPLAHLPAESAGSASSRSAAGPSRFCVDSSGSAGEAEGSVARTFSADGKAWPSFRRRFFLSLCGLWVGVSTIIVGRQIVVRVATVDRMFLDSLRVFGYGWLTCVTTGLGAVPFLFVGAGTVGESTLAVANAAAAGMMLAASVGMLQEAHEHCGYMDWQIFAGLLVGGLFIRASEQLHGDEGEGDDEGIAVLHSALVERRHWRKAMLIFTVMFCHSAAEGIAVGVAFSRQLKSQFGVYISLLLAVHNVPEGLAVALVLVPRGVSATLTTFIAMLTSVPQPLLALAAFLFVEVFQCLLPLGLAFAAGAMVYVCLHELLAESVEQLGLARAALASLVSFITMSVCIYVLQSLTGI
eukprot:gb/GFBE01036636.1/.p1 GENE.gb/GFBE01036636.1/~~gb/GFBE01036636.1/.p1  ORF type:complete len:730 (+),score=139.31 gb/GFBE01036636.1/:1-2190(+)